MEETFQITVTLNQLATLRGALSVAHRTYQFQIDSGDPRRCDMRDEQRRVEEVLRLLAQHP